MRKIICGGLTREAALCTAITRLAVSSRNQAMFMVTLNRRNRLTVRRSTHFMRSDMTKPKVLVVENDGLVRQCTTELLDEAGFEVIEARDAQEALIRLQQEEGVRVLFANAELPLARDGVELIRRVQKRWPEIGLVITSGHALLASTDLPDSGRFIANTARPEVLVKVIEQAAQVPP